MARTSSVVIDGALDPHERKRVLNILAQRRYRRRKKESHTQLQVIANRLQAENGSVSPPLVSSSLSPRTKTSSPCPTATPETEALAILQDDDRSQSSETIESSIVSLEFDLSDFLQQDDILTATFPDSFVIAVPELDLLRAARDNATRLQSQNLLFDLTASSVFISGMYPIDLPQPLQPTSTQLSVPHHPVLDVLPWPAVRDRLIKTFAEPEQPYSLVGLIYDLEDSGVRIWGDDPAQGTNWEVQQKFLDSWWWALDRSVIQSSNQRRRDRGEIDLIMPR